MEGGTSSPSSPPAVRSSPKLKFSVYQNPTLSAALTAHSLRPSSSALLLLLFASIASFTSLISVSSREEDLVKRLVQNRLSISSAQLLVKCLEAGTTLIFIASLSAFIRAVLLRNANNGLRSAAAVSSSQKPKEEKTVLSQRQLILLGLKPMPAETFTDAEPLKKPPKSKTMPSSEPLVPIRRSSLSYTPSRPPRIGPDQLCSSGGKKAALSPMSPSSHSQTVASPSTPWSRQSAGSSKGIQSEAMLEQYLAHVDEKITESVSIVATSSPPVRGFVISTPSSAATQGTPSGAARVTPLRPARMSPGSHQKYSTPPKKGEGELPPPLSIEQAVEAFEFLGIYPQIELWRDRLRQWFSSMLINPLLEKIETSHLQLMQAAASVGISITVSQIGSDPPSTTAPVNLSPISGAKEWLPTVAMDEDSLLHQLCATLLQARDGSMSHSPISSMQQPQANPLLPVIQTCIDAITEHQRLNTLMKGELIKGLLPLSSVRADYTVKRVRDLSEGTCVKNYDYMGNGGGYEKGDKKWSKELPTDSHLLLYLFCAFLEHPKWMLHVDPTSYSGAQSSKNPLFLGLLPPVERFPEKYVAVISGVPTVLHPGACILAVGKQCPPIFALYWDMKPQFSLQGRTALWDSILLLCHRLETSYGGFVRGVHLGSSAFNILPVLDSDTEN